MAFPPAILATGTLAAVAVDNGPVAGFLALTTIAAMGLYVLDQA